MLAFFFASCLAAISRTANTSSESTPAHLSNVVASSPLKQNVVGRWIPVADQRVNKGDESGAERSGTGSEDWRTSPHFSISEGEEVLWFFGRKNDETQTGPPAEDEELAHSWQHYGEIGSNYGYTGTGTSMPSSPLDA